MREDRRSAPALHARTAYSDLAGECAVSPSPAFEINGHIICVETIVRCEPPRAWRGRAIPRREPDPGELHRPAARYPSPLRRLCVKRELPSTDLDLPRRGADDHVRQVRMNGDRSALGQTDDRPGDEGIDLVAHPRVIGGDGDEIWGQPLEQPREVNVSAGMAHGHVPSVGDLYRSSRTSVRPAVGSNRRLASAWSQ